MDKAAQAIAQTREDAFGTGLPTRRTGAAWITRGAPFHADGGQHSNVMTDSCTTIHPVTQAPHPGCPRSPGTLSAISMEWVSAINGMRNNASLRANRDAFQHYAFRPRVMVDVSNRSQQTTLFGRTYASPFGIAPVGISAMAAYRGD